LIQNGASPSLRPFAFIAQIDMMEPDGIEIPEDGFRDEDHLALLRRRNVPAPSRVRFEWSSDAVVTGIDEAMLDEWRASDAAFLVVLAGMYITPPPPEVNRRQPRTAG
jgi:hypothetical protein